MTPQHKIFLANAIAYLKKQYGVEMKFLNIKRDYSNWNCLYIFCADNQNLRLIAEVPYHASGSPQRAKLFVLHEDHEDIPVGGYPWL